MQISIGLASTQDAVEIAILVGALLDEIMGRIGIKAFEFNQQECEMTGSELIARGVYKVLLAREAHSGKAVGLLSMYESYALYTGGAYGTIPECYVVPEYRSQGLGKRLLEEAKALGQTQGWKRLEVTTPPLPQFEETLKFYNMNGFEVTGGKKLKAVLAL